MPASARPTKSNVSVVIFFVDGQWPWTKIMICERLIIVCREGRVDRAWGSPPPPRKWPPKLLPLRDLSIEQNRRRHLSPANWTPVPRTPTWTVSACARSNQFPPPKTNQTGCPRNCSGAASASRSSPRRMCACRTSPSNIRACRSRCSQTPSSRRSARELQLPTWPRQRNCYRVPLTERPLYWPAKAFHWRQQPLNSWPTERQSCQTMSSTLTLASRSHQKRLRDRVQRGERFWPSTLSTWRWKNGAHAMCATTAAAWWCQGLPSCVTCTSIGSHINQSCLSRGSGPEWNLFRRLIVAIATCARRVCGMDYATGCTTQSLHWNRSSQVRLACWQV